MADKAIQLLTDKALYEKIARNARLLVNENYTYYVIAKKLDQIYQRVASK